MNEKFCILIRISWKFVSNRLIYNEPGLVQVMAWRRRGDKPLLEAMLTRLTDAYAAQGGWIKNMNKTRSFRVCIDGLVQDCSISIANALEILQSCIEPSIYSFARSYDDGTMPRKRCPCYSLQIAFNAELSLFTSWTNVWTNSRDLPMFWGAMTLTWRHCHCSKLMYGIMF